MKLGNYQDNTIDAFGDTYEFLMGMYASNTGKSVGEYYSPAGGLRIAGPHRHRTDTASIIGHLHYLGVPCRPSSSGWFSATASSSSARRARPPAGSGTDGHTVQFGAAARAAYIFDNLPLTQISASHGIPVATLRSWKRKGAEQGDDWDKLRAANVLSGEGMEAVGRQTLSEYVLQHKALMAEIITAQDMTASQKTTALALLADSFNKMVAANTDGVICERDLQDANRLNARIPSDVVNGLHVFAVVIDLLL